jgi:geranylgeranyl diphosphate synthase type II
LDLKNCLETRLTELVAGCDKLHKAARYALFSGGKRLRPLLLLSTAIDLGANFQKALEAACALELIHTYSLIHDDLPAMDDDDERRGKPTLHIAFDEATAILTGDFLLTRAFELLACSEHLTDQEKIRFIQLLSKASGSEGLIGGQMMDLFDYGHTELMHKLKTASLFGCALALAAELAPQKPSIDMLQLGYHIGALFQLLDDLEDSDHPQGSCIAFKQALIKHAQIHDLLKKICLPALQELIKILDEKLQAYQTA